MAFTVRLPASTANLGPGYDILGLALSIYNQATVYPAEAGDLRITTQGAGADRLPTDAGNLFFTAAAALAERVGRPLPGMRVEMRMDVPLARGLGSSSTAIVGGILTANRLLNDPLDADGLLDLASEIEGHPDNASPCLRGGLTISTLDNGRVVCIRALPDAALKAVVAIPDFQLKTSAARNALPTTVSHADAAFNAGRCALLVASLLTGDRAVLTHAMEDRLHQPYRAHLVPGYHEVAAAAREAGALGAALSGAGPTIFAFATGNTAAVAQAMVDAWKDHGISAHALEVDIDRTGAVIE